MKKLTLLAILVLSLAGCGNPTFHKWTGLPEPGFLRDNPEAAQTLLMMQQGYNQNFQNYQMMRPRSGAIIGPDGQTYYYYGN